jgi:hypothetical protein
MEPFKHYAAVFVEHSCWVGESLAGGILLELVRTLHKFRPDV